MCRVVKYKNTSNVRIDKCMIKLIKNLKTYTNLETVGCCCGHDLYHGTHKIPMTILVSFDGVVFDLVSGVTIPRKRRYYKKAKQGYYYIPEVLI